MGILQLQRHPGLKKVTSRREIKRGKSTAVRQWLPPYDFHFQMADVLGSQCCLDCHLIQWRTTKHCHRDAVNRAVRKRQICASKAWKAGTSTAAPTQHTANHPPNTYHALRLPPTVYRPPPRRPHTKQFPLESFHVQLFVCEKAHLLLIVWTSFQSFVCPSFFLSCRCVFAYLFVVLLFILMAAVVAFQAVTVFVVCGCYCCYPLQANASSLDSFWTTFRHSKGIPSW